MSVFKYLDYRKYIEETVEERKKVTSKFTYSHLAKVMNIQKTYLSQVLSGKSELNPDQIFLLSEYLQHSDEEAQFLLSLLEYSRTSLINRKRKILKKLKTLQETQLKSTKTLKSDFVEPTENTELTKYFLNPYHSIVHVYLTLPLYQKNPFLLVKELGLAKDELQRIIELLHSLEIIRYNPSGPLPVEILKRSVHSGDSQILTTTQQILFRSMTLDKLIRIPREKRYSFNATFSSTYDVFLELKNEFLEFMKRAQSQVAESEAKEVYHLSFDLLPLKEDFD